MNIRLIRTSSLSKPLSRFRYLESDNAGCFNCKYLIYIYVYWSIAKQMHMRIYLLLRKLTYIYVYECLHTIPKEIWIDTELDLYDFVWIY